MTTAAYDTNTIYDSPHRTYDGLLISPRTGGTESSSDVIEGDGEETATTEGD